MGLANATGRYFKVVDSDDWLDEHAMAEIMVYLRRQAELPHPTDLVIGNYVYEKVHEGARTVMHYRNVFPEGREFGWADVGHFWAKPVPAHALGDLSYRSFAGHSISS